MTIRMLFLVGSHEHDCSLSEHELYDVLFTQSIECIISAKVKVLSVLVRQSLRRLSEIRCAPRGRFWGIQQQSHEDSSSEHEGYL